MRVVQVLSINWGRVPNLRELLVGPTYHPIETLEWTGTSLIVTRPGFDTNTNELDR